MTLAGLVVKRSIRIRDHVLRYGILLVAVLTIVFGWILTFRIRTSLTDAVIATYQQTELEIVRSVARSITHFVADNISHGDDAADREWLEQEIFRLFVEPVRLLENGDAWIYAPDHVVFDRSSDFPDRYRGKSMAEVFETQVELGANHYEDMTESVMNAREGFGWYVWLPEKGKEIAAWTPARVGDYVWIVGVSTPLPEIVRSVGGALQIRSNLLLVSIATVIAIVLLAVWIVAEQRRARYERISDTQSNLSSALNVTIDMDDALDLCLITAVELDAVDVAAVYLINPDDGLVHLRRAIGAGYRKIEFNSDLSGSDARYITEGLTRYISTNSSDASHTELLEQIDMVSIGFIPLRDRGVVLGSLFIGTKSKRSMSTHVKRCAATIGAVLGGTLARLSSEEKLRESETKFRSVVDTAKDAIVAADASGNIVVWSNGAVGMFGYDEIDATRMNLDLLFLEEPEDTGAGEGDDLIRRRCVRSDGSVFSADISSAYWFGQGGAYRTYIFRDVSEQEHAEDERRELQEKLERAERMEALGILAGGVAHDLNNLLTPVVGYADLMLGDVDNDSVLREPLQFLRESAERAGAVVQDLLTLGRRGSYQMQIIDICRSIREYVASAPVTDAERRFPNVEIDQHYPDRPLYISGSHPHLMKAFVNLMLNAFEAMPSGGTLTIWIGRHELQTVYVGYESIAPGSYIVVRVTDTGIGIPDEDLERIFEPFYTKKKMGRSGTGLGLAVVYGVIHDHGGMIDVKSIPGKGTEISLWFPVAEGSVPDNVIAADGSEHTADLLIVEDQEEQRTLTEKLLTRRGYRVRAAASGKDAIDMLRTRPADVVILDMIIDETMDGLDCYREILGVNPEQRAIVVSGYAETERVREAQRIGAGRFVRKPYRIDDLVEAIQSELSQKS